MSDDLDEKGSDGKSQGFGDYVRERRQTLLTNDRAYSVRGVARTTDIEPSYLSKIERGVEAPPSEATIRRLAAALDEDPDVLLALAGKVSDDLQSVIRRRPQLFAQLIRELAASPDDAVLRIVREVRDGNW